MSVLFGCSFGFLFFNDTESTVFFNDTATTEIYTLSLHDALPILVGVESIQMRTLKAEE